MDHGQLTMIADKCPWVFSESLLNACAQDGRFGKRQRIITPFRLGLALTTTCASQPVETIADFHCAFNAFWGTIITYKAFSNHVAKPHGADCARTMAARLISATTLKGLGFEKGRAFRAFRHIVRQDGSSFAIHDSLREVFPGRCKTVKPAAVALHTTVDLRCDAPTTVVVTPDTANEQAFLPEPAALRDSVVLADRGYIDVPSLRRVQDEHGFLLIRAKAGMHPQVVEAVREDGKRLRSLRHKPLKAVHATLPKRQRVEFGGRWEVDGHPRCLRLIISGNPRPKSFGSFLTNLPPKRYPLEGICRAYTWRWHVELLLQDWKSYANLHAFDTTKVAIVEGLMWTAIAAAALKRFLAPMTQLLLEVPMSTRKVAMCAMHVLGDIGRALQSGDVAGLYAALEAAVTYLACHAPRAHPARDRHTGRSQLGLEPLFGSDDVIEFAEAAEVLTYERKFLATLFVTILVLRGRVTFRNLSRYCDYSARTIARQCREPFDWPDFHQCVLRTVLDPRSELISAHDASFIPKSGKQTCGLGHFFNGCTSRAERGLEMSTLAVVDVTRRCALTLAVAQTPPGEKATKAEPDDTRIDFYKQQLRAHRHRLPPSITSHGVDGYYAKKQYIDEVVSLDLPAITTLRSDADCMCLYTGPHPKRRGARRKYAGKVNFQDLSRFEDLGTRAEEPHLHLYTAVVWHKTLQRRLRLVVLLHRKDPAKPRFIVSGSPDPALNGHKLLDLYAARFQIEFLFRDSKQFTGLLDCQARAASALDFHFNASLATLNLVRAEDLGMPQGQEPHVFSMASWKQCQCNERLLDIFMENLALDPTWVKNHACYEELRTYGAIAA